MTSIFVIVFIISLRSLDVKDFLDVKFTLCLSLYIYLYLSTFLSLYLSLSNVFENSIFKLDLGTLPPSSHFFSPIVDIINCSFQRSFDAKVQMLSP